MILATHYVPLSYEVYNILNYETRFVYTIILVVISKKKYGYNMIYKYISGG